MPAGYPQLLRRTAPDRGKPVAGTERAQNPFFSPDGEWIGFFADGKLKKIQAGGGSPVTICDIAFGFGAAWADDGTIVFGILEGGLSRVSAGGGQPQPWTTLSKDERVHRWPALFPGSPDVLFAVSSEGWGTSRIAIQSLDSSEHHILTDGGAMAPRYASRDQIVFARNGSLLGIGLDRARRAVVGSPVQLVEGVMMDATIGGQAQYALSAQGTLVYVPGEQESTRRTLFWVDRGGAALALAVPPRGFQRPRISPNGRQVAFTIGEAGEATDVWVLSLERGTLTRITHTVGEDESPVWTQDGKRVTYSSTRGQSRITFRKSADGSGAEETLFTGTRHQHLNDGTPDGKTLLSEEESGPGRDVGNLYYGRAGEDKVTRLYLETPF
jgi:serine/threonine-protein kinase